MKMVGQLLYCAATNPERARVGRILAALLLIFMVMTFASMGLPFVRGSGSISPISIITMLILIILYTINRQGYVTVAASGVTVMIIGVMGAVALTPDSTVATGLISASGLVIPVALAGVMMPWRGVVGVLLTASAVTVVLYLGASPALRAAELAQPGMISGALFFALVILWAVGGLALLASSQIWLTLARLEQQNNDLRAQSSRERALLNQMSVTGLQVRHAATAIATAAAQQASGATEQAAALTQVSSMIEELNQTAQQIAGVADTVAGAAEQALHSAQHGQESVLEGIEGMKRIMGRIEDIVTRNLSLASQSQRIAEIVTTINEIAGQTHILALNAAIESAGVGEAGARFAVIAGEVRKLAQHSTAATHEIQEIISQHQASIAAAVMATEEGLKEGAAGLHLAQQSGAANAAIISEVEQAAELMHTINKATQQQRTASAQVVITMHEMVEVTQQVAASSHQTLEAVQQLETVAQALVVEVETLPPAAPPRRTALPVLPRDQEQQPLATAV
jgi:methyl-accepting chemotaxis protein